MKNEPPKNLWVLAINYWVPTLHRSAIEPYIV